MSKTKASAAAEMITKKPRLGDSTAADGSPTVEDEATVAALGPVSCGRQESRRSNVVRGRPKLVGNPSISLHKGSGPIVSASHPAPSTE
uniref:Uncharacterized protein n=1 Tax=Leersia perrieri TaxID=77586 RepID=A0A0D9XY15_9ORYZ